MEKRRTRIIELGKFMFTCEGRSGGLPSLFSIDWSIENLEIMRRVVSLEVVASIGVGFLPQRVI